MQTNGPLSSGAINALAVNGTIIFAGTFSGGVFRSDDNGIVWNLINNGLTNADYCGSLRSILCLLVNGSNVFAGVRGCSPATLTMSPPTVYYGVYRSSDSGTNWTMTSIGLPYQYAGYLVMGGNVYYNFVAHWITALSAIGDTLFAGTGWVYALSAWNGVYRSTDNGSIWNGPFLGQLLKSNNDIMYLLSNGIDLFAGIYNGGVYRSMDRGTTWTAASLGLANTSIRALLVNGTDLFACTFGGGVFLSTDNGANWTDFNTGLPVNTYIASLAVSGNYLFAGTGYFGSSYYAAGI